jgi:hypothetical protein
MCLQLVSGGGLKVSGSPAFVCEQWWWVAVVLVEYKADTLQILQDSPHALPAVCQGVFAQSVFALLPVQPGGAH